VGPILGRMLLATATAALRRAAVIEMRRVMVLRIESQMAKKLYQKVVALKQQTEEAGRLSQESALEIARGLSSGTISSHQLAVMGHPYARRRPRPPQDAAIINRQSGRFYHGWRLDGGKLVNDTGYAPFLFHGTRRMIARPILVRIGMEVGKKRRTIYKAAISRALRS